MYLTKYLISRQRRSSTVDAFSNVFDFYELTIDELYLETILVFLYANAIT